MQLKHDLSSRLSQNSSPLVSRARDPSSHLVGDVVGRELLQHLIGQSQHGALARLPAPAATVLGLDADDGAQRLLRQVRLVGDVSVGMEAEHLYVRQQQAVNIQIKGNFMIPKGNSTSRKHRDNIRQTLGKHSANLGQTL